MLRKFLRTLVSAAVLVSVEVPIHADQREADVGAPSAFDVRDGIELNYFAAHPGGEGGPILVSPDGSRFAFVTTRGFLQDNTAQSTLWIVTRKSVAASQLGQAGVIPLAKVRVVPTRKSYEPHGPVISSLRWSLDSEHLYFLAQRNDGTQSLQEANMKDMRSKTVSRDSQDVVNFAFGPSEVIYATVPRSLQAICRNNDTAHFLRDASLSDVLFPCDYTAFASHLFRQDIWQRYSNGKVVHTPHPGNTDELPDKPHDTDIFSVSPDGKFVVRLAPASSIPKHWLTYDAVAGHEDRRVSASPEDVISPSNRWRLRQYRVTDLATGKSFPLLDEFVGNSIGDGDAVRSTWSLDSSRILITNTTMPSTLDREGNDAHPVCAVASVDLPSLVGSCIVRSPYTFSSGGEFQTAPPFVVEDISFGKNRDLAFIKIARHGVGETQTYQFKSGTWQPIHDDSTFHAMPPAHAQAGRFGVSLVVRQDPNSLPTLWATGSEKKREAMIWNPNSRWDHYPFGNAVACRWTDNSGYMWRGMLLFPEHYDRNRLYPLVIQTHGIRSEEFLIDGQYPTAEAARPLSHAGFFVLQIPYRSDHVGSPQEAPDQLRGFQGAIDYLVQQYSIDRSKVGIVGFSRTGFHVEEALVHEPSLFAAAVIADGTDTSYMPYRLFGHTDTFVSRDIERLIGGRPSADGLKLWQERASGFHLDQVRAPVLVQALGPASLLMEWELFTTLYDLKDPVDLLYLPDAQHVLQKPANVYASQQATLDWFRFWLQGKGTRP